MLFRSDPFVVNALGGNLLTLLLSAPDQDLFYGTSRFPSGPGWDPFTGYGRPDGRALLDRVTEDGIPPEVDLSGIEEVPEISALVPADIRARGELVNGAALNYAPGEFVGSSGRAIGSVMSGRPRLRRARRRTRCSRSTCSTS